MTSIMTSSISSQMISPITLTIGNFLGSFTVEMNPLPHDSNVMHVNIKIFDIWTIKVFFNTKRLVEEYPYEIQIFRNDNNVNDTPFAHRTFLKHISEVDQFVEKFQDWAHKKSYISFDDLKFKNNVAFLTKPNPISQEFTSILQITKHPKSDYYDISFADGASITYPRIKLGYLEKDDITHYMRWFTQWVDHFHEVEKYKFLSQTMASQKMTSQYITSQYMMWIASWNI
jgi:hypothetical protein